MQQSDMVLNKVDEEGYNESDSSPFVNSGLQQWEAERRRWLGRPEQQHSSTTSNIVRAVDIDVDDIIDIILSNRWRAASYGDASGEEKKDGTFHRTVPLPQMVDILVDLWEAEGLDI